MDALGQVERVCGVPVSAVEEHGRVGARTDGAREVVYLEPMS